MSKINKSGKGAMKGFYDHLFIYLCLMPLIVLLNVAIIIFSDKVVLWAQYPMLGWGIGLFCHYINVSKKKYNFYNRMKNKFYTKVIGSHWDKTD